VEMIGKSGLDPKPAQGKLQTGVCTRGVWPLLLVALVLVLGCQESGPAPEAQTQVAALAPAGPVQVLVGDGADLTLDDARIVVRGTWGDGAGQFGKDDEATRPGPMSLAVDAAGAIHLLDQVNARVQRFSRHGSAMVSLAGISETTEDIALSGGAVWTLVFEPGPTPGYSVKRLGARGPMQTVPLGRDKELATGLFITGPASAPDIWVEQRQDTQLRVVKEGRALTPRQQQDHMLGRPNRGAAGQRVAARLTGSHKALIMTVDPEAGANPLFEVVTPMPLVAIQELLTDASGTIYVGLFLVTEGPAPDFKWEQVRKVVVAFKPGVGHKVVEMAALFATTVFRPVAVGQDGALYQLHTSEEGVFVRRWEPVFGEEVRR
jgi:hypothetical protein